jgi:hypothetical protein
MAANFDVDGRRHFGLRPTAPIGPTSAATAGIITIPEATAYTRAQLATRFFPAGVLKYALASGSATRTLLRNCSPFSADAEAVSR